MSRIGIKEPYVEDFGYPRSLHYTEKHTITLLTTDPRGPIGPLTP